MLQPTPAPTPLRAYVRMDALIARSPLQSDVARLRSAEARLRRLGQASGGVGSGTGEEYTLGPLSAGSVPADVTGARNAREERAQAGSERLRQTVEAELNAYEAERMHRQQQKVDQRRAELEAVSYGRAAEREQAEREKAIALALRDVNAEAAQISVLRAKLAVLIGQLGNRNLVTGEREKGTFPPVLDKDQFEADVAAVLANPTVSFIEVASDDGKKEHFIDMQARLEAKRRILFAALGVLRERLDKLQAEAISRADKAAMAVAQQQLDQIERDLEAMSVDQDLQFKLRDQRVQLGDVLAAHAAITDKVSAERGQLAAIGSDAGAGSVRFTSLFGPTVSQNDRAGTTRAADRVAHQRERLQAFIRIDVATSVEDAARTRNVDVIKLSEESAKTPRPDLSGRRDMTAQFIRWTNPGSQLQGPVAVKPATPNPAPTTAAHRLGG